MIGHVMHRCAVISRISDALIVAKMDINCSVVSKQGDEVVLIDVEVDHKGTHMNGETHQRHFSLRKDVYYNLPRHLHTILKDEALDSPLFTSPIESSRHASSMVFDMLNAIRKALGDGTECVDLDRYLSEGQFISK